VPPPLDQLLPLDLPGDPAPRAAAEEVDQHALLLWERGGVSAHRTPLLP